MTLNERQFYANRGHKIPARNVILYHGTTHTGAKGIDAGGIRPNDMGVVYATTSEARAEVYARKRATDNNDGASLVTFHANPGKLTTTSHHETHRIHWGKIPARNVLSIVQFEPTD